MDAPRRVKVQVGTRPDVAPTEVVHAIMTDNAASHISASLASSTRLADLCASRPRKRKGDPQEDDSHLLVNAIPKKQAKPAPRPIFLPVASSSQTKKEQGPRVEVVDGKIVIRESSLTVESADQNAAEFEYEEVEEGAHATSRYSSYSNKRNGRVWGIEETRLFYQSLRQCGTDFSMMQTFFPHRTRRELKLKFRREESAHPELIKTALKTQLPLELVPFEVALGVDLTSPPRTPLE